MDDHLRKTFASKFEAFEAPVGEDQWSSIKSGIVNKPLRKAVVSRRLSIGLILLLITTVSAWFLVSEAYADRDDQTLTELEKTTRQADNSVNVQPEKGSGSSIVDEVGDKPEELVDHPGISNVLRGEDESMEFQESETEIKIIAEPDLSAELQGQLPLYLLSIEIPLYEFHRDSSQPGPFPMIISRMDSATRTSRKTSFRPFFGLNLNYLNLRPNPNDNVYFTDIGSSVDLSLQQWGVSAGYEMTFRLSDGLKLRNELNLSVRQHRLSFKYLPDASDSENTEFLSVENTFRPLILGVSAGLSYDLGSLGAQKRELDLGFYYESVIDDDLGNQDLFQYPGSLINLNMGLTFYPKEFNWGIRVFGYYSLNKKYSVKALSMTPYGLGIQFLRDKARN